MKEKIHYIYVLRHPTTNEIRYVGRSVRPTTRLSTHIRSGRVGLATRTARWIKSLLDKGLLPKQQVVFQHTDSNYIEHLEYALIKGLKKRGFRLTNIHGKGYSGNYIRTEEAIKRATERLLKFRRENPSFQEGKKHSEASCVARSKKMAARWKTEEYRTKVVKAMTGLKKNLTPEQIARNSKVSKEWWVNNPEKGEELKRKLSERNKRNWADPVFREKMRLANVARDEARRLKATQDQGAKDGQGTST